MTEWGQNLGGTRGRWCNWLCCLFLKIICEHQPSAEVLLPALVVGLVLPAQLAHMYSTTQLLLTDSSIIPTCWLASPPCTLQAKAVKEGQGLASWRIICNKYSQRTREPDDFKNLSEQFKREDDLGEVLPDQLTVVHLYLKWKVDEHTSLRRMFSAILFLSKSQICSPSMCQSLGVAGNCCVWNSQC